MKLFFGIPISAVSLCTGYKEIAGEADPANPPQPWQWTIKFEEQAGTFSNQGEVRVKAASLDGSLVHSQQLLVFTML